jgi:hypothetical protein
MTKQQAQQQVQQQAQNTVSKRQKKIQELKQRVKELDLKYGKPILDVSLKEVDHQDVFHYLLSNQKLFLMNQRFYKMKHKIPMHEQPRLPFSQSK